jgi:hypothetical protein
LFVFPSALYPGVVAGTSRYIQAAVLMISLVGSAACARSAQAAEPDLRTSLGAIRTAFLEGDAPAILRQFPGGTRVYVSIPGFESGAFLGPGPLRALVNRLFHETRTVFFEFDALGPEGFLSRAPTESRFVKARWSYHLKDSALTQTEELYLTLRRSSEDGEWRVVQLRTSR